MNSQRQPSGAVILASTCAGQWTMLALLLATSPAPAPLPPGSITLEGRSGAVLGTWDTSIVVEPADLERYAVHVTLHSAAEVRRGSPPDRPSPPARHAR